MSQNTQNAQTAVTNLKLDWCTHTAAKYACEHWHYSKCMPAGKTVKIGVWENDKFVGCVIFSLGAGNMTRGEKYGLKKTHEIAELSRVAFSKHQTPVSRILKIAIKMLRKFCPKLQMIISFSDYMNQGHIGTIYQASGFIYTGSFDKKDGFVIKGKFMHDRSIYSRGWIQTLPWLRENVDPNAQIHNSLKHRYLLPLNATIRERIEPLGLPYPKRAPVV